MAFEKSTFSFPVGCVEVERYGLGTLPEPAILIRDSKLGSKSPVLLFTSHEWEAFIKGVKEGQFDLSSDSNQGEL